jgi:hypothetical protein
MRPTNVPNLQMCPTAGPDCRYDTPTASKVAAIIPSIENANIRDIVYCKRRADGELNLQQIHQSYELYNPLHFILLHPKGEHGYYPNYPNRRPSTRAITH